MGLGVEWEDVREGEGTRKGVECCYCCCYCDAGSGYAVISVTIHLTHSLYNKMVSIR